MRDKSQNIWFNREKSIHWLTNELTEESKVIEDGFHLLKFILLIFNELGDRLNESQTGQFSRICSITLAKFSHLSLGCFSLSFDGLSQESGALLRPLIESYELLVYFRQDPSRINQVIDGTLPSAGIIGKCIVGDFKDLREYLNDNASHFSYKYESVRHMFGQDYIINPFPNHTRDVFRKNLEILNAFQVFTLFEAVNCLFVVGYDEPTLVYDLEEWRGRCTRAFAPTH